jgi:hypothetical protein
MAKLRSQIVKAPVDLRRLGTIYSTVPATLLNRQMPLLLGQSRDQLPVHERRFHQSITRKQFLDPQWTLHHGASWRWGSAMGAIL